VIPVKTNRETVPALPRRATHLALPRFLRIAVVVAGAFAAGFLARSAARLVDAPPSSATAVVSAPITPIIALPFVHTALLP